VKKSSSNLDSKAARKAREKLALLRTAVRAIGDWRIPPVELRRIANHAVEEHSRSYAPGKTTQAEHVVALVEREAARRGHARPAQRDPALAPKEVERLAPKKPAPRAIAVLDDSPEPTPTTVTDEAAKARLSALWNHEGWGDLFAVREQRWRLLVLAIEGIQRDRGMLVELLRMLPHAARKPDPDATEYADTAQLLDIFSALAAAYELDEEGRVALVQGETLARLHGVAEHLLKSRTTASLASAADKRGVSMRTRKGWGDQLVAVLERAAQDGVVGGDELSMYVRQRALWSRCPFENVVLEGDNGPRRVDLQSLDWNRLPPDYVAKHGFQLAEAQALDAWCYRDPLRPDAPGERVDTRAKATELLRCLGVSAKDARNALYAADDMQAKRRARRAG
jgi:hypothetical protein